MKRFWVTLVCTFGLSSGAYSQQPATQDPTSTSHPFIEAPAQNTSTPGISDYSQEPFVIEQYYSTARFESDGTGEQDLSVRIRVQSDAGVQQFGELVFGFNSANEQMDIRYVRIRKADGTIVAAKPDAVKEMTSSIARDAPVYTDYKEKHITVPALAPGETLEYEIVTRLVSPLAPNQFWFDHNFLDDSIVLDERLEVIVPAGRQIRLESSHFPFEKTEEPGRTVYRW